MFQSNPAKFIGMERLRDMILIRSALIRLLTAHVTAPIEKQSSKLTDTCGQFKAASHPN